MDTQFNVDKQNSIFDLIDIYRIMWETVYDESHMYDFKEDLSYFSIFIL